MEKYPFIYRNILDFPHFSTYEILNFYNLLTFEYGKISLYLSQYFGFSTLFNICGKLAIVECAKSVEKITN